MKQEKNEKCQIGLPLFFYCFIYLLPRVNLGLFVYSKQRSVIDIY